MINFSPGKTIGRDCMGTGRGGSAGVVNFGDAGGMYLGEVARATRVPESDRDNCELPAED
ncbi:MAG: hypothetical protein QF685_07420 [Verrucomicrobiota bacterium]|nr:hypothetical protein [Verrucomicrobiota bacterium]